MKLTIVADEGEIVRVACEGQIAQLVSHGNEPMANLLGPTAYSRKVLLSLERTTFINSSGISWLLICHKYFAQGGGQLVVHSVPPLVSQVLNFVRLPSIMNFAADEKAARTVALGGAL
jgi:anti-anti-sigma factor